MPPTPHIAIRLKPEMKEQWAKAASAKGMSLTAFIIYAVSEQLRDQRRTPTAYTQPDRVFKPDFKDKHRGK